MALAKPLSTIFQYIEENKENFLERLKNAIAIHSVPTPENNNLILDMINWVNELLNSFEIQTELRNVQKGSCSDYLTPVLLGNLERGFCPNKATVLIYGHLDVRDAQKEDGWKNEPFELFQEDDFLYGRGVFNKSSLAAWLNAIEAYHSLEIDFPVNIKFIFESSGTQCSHGLKKLLLAEKEKFLAHVDYICVSEGSWLQPEIPCLIKSTRGICCFLVEVERAKNSDSDDCGKMVVQEMLNMLFVLQSLVDEKDNLNISLPEKEITADEDLDICRSPNCNLNNFLDSACDQYQSQTWDECKIFDKSCPESIITIHDISSSCTEATEIPRSVTARVSIKTTHSQNAEKVFESVKQYLQNVWSQNGYENKLKITLEKSSSGWLTDIDHDHFQVGVKAFRNVYEATPLFLNSECTMPAVNILYEVFERNVIVLPLGYGENRNINEKFQRLNYQNSSKVLAAYLYGIGELPRLLNSSSTSFVSCISCPSTEACVCGRFGEKIEAASGDAEKCICPDKVCTPKSVTYQKEEVEVIQDELKPDVLETLHEVEALLEAIMEELTTEESAIGDIIEEAETKEDPMKQEDISEVVNEPEMITTLKKSKICECPLISVQNSLKPVAAEIVSLASNVTVVSRDPTPIIQPEKPKKEIVPSVETLRCFCTPKLYRNFIRQKSITLERQYELMETMRSFGSVFSGISAGESQPNLKTTKTVAMGCVCPEKSTDTVFEQSRQIDRMLCPIKNTKKEEKCTKGGKRKHHIIGPAPIEEDSEISLGPLSHCSCSSEEVIVVKLCDCDKRKSDLDITKENTSPLPANLEDEVD